jgi:hypothetical protein
MRSVLDEGRRAILARAFQHRSCQALHRVASLQPEQLWYARRSTLLPVTPLSSSVNRKRVLRESRSSLATTSLATGAPSAKSARDARRSSTSIRPRPGSTLSGGSFAVSNRAHSWPWRGFAASKEDAVGAHSEGDVDNIGKRNRQVLIFLPRRNCALAVFQNRPTIHGSLKLRGRHRPGRYSTGYACSLHCRLHCGAMGAEHAEL